MPIGLHTMAKRLNAGTEVPELATVHADELIEVLVQKMRPTKNNGLLSFEETIIKTCRSEMAKTCFIILAADRSLLFPDSRFGYLTPVIPLVYAMQVANYAHYADTLKLESAFKYRAGSEGAYALWDNEENKYDKSSKIALGVELAEALRNRTGKSRSLASRVNERRRLKHFSHPGANTSVEYIQEMQLDIAKADRRSARMILDINNWDNLPAEMCS